MSVRIANEADLDGIEKIYEDIHTAEEQGVLTTGWIRGVYPTRAVAESALERGDLFVMEERGEIVGAAIINRVQLDVYEKVKWKYDAPNDKIMVLHTLAISPSTPRQGFGRRFERYYEEYAAKNGCVCLRIDTNERNTIARSLYKKLGYIETGIVPCTFNGIENVKIVLLEKSLL